MRKADKGHVTLYWQATAGLARLGDADAKARIAAALKDASAEGRIWGAMAAGYAGGDEWLKALVPMMKAEQYNTAVVYAVWDLLGRPKLSFDMNDEEETWEVGCVVYSRFSGGQCEELAKLAGKGK